MPTPPSSPDPKFTDEQPSLFGISEGTCVSTTPEELNLDATSESKPLPAALGQTDEGSCLLTVDVRKWQRCGFGIDLE